MFPPVAFFTPGAVWQPELGRLDRASPQVLQRRPLVALRPGGPKY